MDAKWMLHPVYALFLRARAALSLSSLGGGSWNFLISGNQFHDPPPTTSFIETEGRGFGDEEIWMGCTGVDMKLWSSGIENL